MKDTLSCKPSVSSTCFSLDELSPIADAELPEFLPRMFMGLAFDKPLKNPLEQYKIPAEEGGLSSKYKKTEEKIMLLFEEISNFSKEENPTLLLQHLEDKARLAREQLELPVPPLPEPDSTGKSYKLYQKRTDPLQHIEEVWGQWLKYFNPSINRDYLHQDELAKRDPNLIVSLKNQINYKLRSGSSTTRMKDIISPKKSRIDEEIESTLQKKPKDFERLISARRGREYRKKHTPSY